MFCHSKAILLSGQMSGIIKNLSSFSLRVFAGSEPLRLNEFDILFECCGDDDSEAARGRDCAVGACTSDVSGDIRCCSLSSDCVYDGVCYATGWTGDIDGDPDTEICNSGTWDVSCLADGDNTCDNDVECCGSSICQDINYNYYSGFSTTPDYSCVPDNTYCSWSYSPYYYASGSRFDSDVSGSNVFLCCDGNTFRCSLSGDWCNVGPSTRDASSTVCGYKCYCPDDSANCFWGNTPPAESDAAGNCCDSIDNDCDGVVDGAEPSCAESDANGNCGDGVDNDCDGLQDCDDPDCNCCNDLSCDGCKYCSEAACGTGAALGCYWDPALNSGAGLCIQDRTAGATCIPQSPCNQLCWNDFCFGGSAGCVTGIPCCEVDMYGEMTSWCDNANPVTTWYHPAGGGGGGGATGQ